MGNSTSKAPSARACASSSKSKSPAEDGHKMSRTLRDRTNSDALNDTSTLGVTGSYSHLSRSAKAMADSVSLASPPSYSAAISTHPHVSPANTPTRSMQSHRAKSSSSAHSGRVTAGTFPYIGSQYTHVYTIPTGVSLSRTAEYLQAPMRRESVEDALETLRKYDTVIIVDDSSSMRGKRWKDARDALSSLADVTAKYDADGIDVHFLNDDRFLTNVRNSSAVKRLFTNVEPRGITPIGEKLERLLLSYLEKIENAKARELAGDFNATKAIKPVNYIVLTDGAPTDEPEDVVVMAARRLDRGNFPITQVGIQFVQIGDSSKATQFLQELDDNLASDHGVRDIVDTTPFTMTGGELTAEMLTKILLGGINRRVDRKGGGSVL